MTNDNETSVWNSGELNETEYTGFKEENGNMVVVTFTDNDPQVNQNQFGSKVYEFGVVEKGRPKILGVTSKRLMRTLGNFTPLEGKTLKITRTAAGMDTDYEVLE